MRDLSMLPHLLNLNTATLGHNMPGHGAGWSIEQMADACAERGFGGLTLWRRELDGLDLVATGNRIRAAGLAVTGLCRSPFLVGPMAPAPDAVRDDFRSAIDLAASLGAPMLTICVGGVPVGARGIQAGIQPVADILAWAAERAQAAGVRLALEPLHPVYAGDRSCIITTADAVDVCELVHNDALGLAIDVYHVWWDRSLGRALHRAGAERIFAYHVCDWLAATQDVLLDRGMMGDGVADLRQIRQDVEDAGYVGACEVEIFSSRNWWQRSPGDVLDCCMDRFLRLC